MRRFNVRRLAFGSCILLAGIAALGAGGYHLLKKIPFGAAPGGGEYFDYITVDSGARRVYLSHGTEVQVLDADSGATIGTVTGFKRDHGVAIVPELGKGFVSDGELEQAIVFDLKTFKVTGHVKAEKDADSILYEPVSKRIFVFNGEPKSATVIDPAKETVIATLPLGGQPEQAVADGKGMIYDNIEDTNEVIAIDARSLKITSRWPVAPAGQPVAIAMDRQHRRLFISGRKPTQLVMMNADNGKIIGPSYPIGDRVDSNIFDPQSALVASATRAGTLHIFQLDSADKLSPVETIKTEFGAKTMGIDPKTQHIFVDTADFDPPAAPTEKQPNPQPRAKPGTFRVLIYGR